MDASSSKQRSLERVVSQKAMQMSNSFPCQICVVGFLSGICIASLIMATLTSIGSFQFSHFSLLNLSFNSDLNSTITQCSFKPKEIQRLTDLKRRKEIEQDERVSLLYSAWNCVLNNKPTTGTNKCLLKLGINESNLLNAPHFENCKAKSQLHDRLDKRMGNNSFPPWTSWNPLAATTEGAYPPWNLLQIAGSDEENYPLTRKVQRDIWLHQHPSNCSDANVKFLLADWERLPGFGIGAQIAGMCGLLAVAINEGRVLVTNFYNRADHDGCKGSARSSWNCYFFAETSLECRQRAFELMKSDDSLSRGILTTKENYTSKHIWTGPTPRIWGNPWNYLQPTTDINGSLVVSHRKMDRRWWRAQAVRYLMRFPTEYTCNLLNEARHAAFGKIAAKMVLESLVGEWPKEVIEKTKEYSSRWKFHYTKVRRQDRSNVSMAEYEGSLGRERGTNYPLVNFLMAADSDYFVGALGSTWCFLIDGMRNTGGKVMSGYLSVNKDRFW
ncbi:uncharacterized protein LOC131610685 isoform X3 [Vicia villosa]|uniref:uncharacterized protein LOC131610685 isoform X3 n=1 Tax=Vicia villosa TaxID=3911 RepID=UPI00273C84E3|nr:uncharacterized protein LOC131610685 isoform X3 [Vicia villosa]